MAEQEESELKAIILKAKDGKALTAYEQERFERWLTQGDNLVRYQKLVAKEWDHEQYQIFSNHDIEGDWAKIQQGVMRMEKENRRYPALLKYAAIILLVLASGVIYYLARNVSGPAQMPIASNDLQPGGQKAILTLANGKQIDLTNSSNGALAQQTGIQILKTANGQLSYHITGDPSRVGGDTNIITTPKGGLYSVVLIDGSRVWLNAASSLRFPTRFSGQERRVFLKGEAYFEIAHNAAKPFHVTSEGSQDVQVLGTHFNIKNYDGEPDIKTTLLEGSIKIKLVNGQSKILSPGQQAKTNQSKGSLTIDENANLDEAMAWHNNEFYFTNASTEEVVRELARWYNISYDTNTPLPKGSYSGHISRQLTSSHVLKMLSVLEPGLNIKIEDRKISVQ